VGLEHLFARVSRLASTYEKDRGLSYATFHALVVESFGLKKNPDESVVHLGNFYRTLNLLKLIGRQLEPLYQLDALAIICMLFKKDAARRKVACRLILTQSILEADGDVVLNGLLAGFEPDRFRLLLESMCAEKSRGVRRIVRSPALFAKLNDIVTIRNQASVVQAPSVRAGTSDRFARHVVPLSSTRRRTFLTPENRAAATISEDYIHKAIQTRRRWVEDLSLYEDGQMTDLGQRVLDGVMARVVTRTPEGAAAFWGYTSELARVRISPSKLDPARPDEACESWDLLAALHKAYVPSRKPQGTHLSDDQFMDFLLQLFNHYRRVRSDKSLIRNALPLYVAEPVLAAWCAATHRPLPPLHAFLRREDARRTRRVQKMTIRGTIGSLYFMR
jgi:hypothetical protein